MKVVRFARQDDLDNVDAFLNQYQHISAINTKEMLEKLIKHYNNSIVIAEKDKEIVGILSLFYHPIVTKIADFVVDTRYRCQGIGREMLQFAVDYCMDNGVDAVNGYIHTDNQKSLRLASSIKSVESDTKPNMAMWIDFRSKT